MNEQTNFAAEMAKATPPIAVSSMTICGYPVADVVQLVTLIYVTCLLGKWIWDRLR